MEVISLPEKRIKVHHARGRLRDSSPGRSIRSVRALQLYQSIGNLNLDSSIDPIADLDPSGRFDKSEQHALATPDRKIR